MIWSGLPYSKEDIEKAFNEGAKVDMSKVNFPTCETLEENYQASFVYLRNTDYEVEFHFENMNYEQKVALIKTYYNTKIKYDIPILDSTLVAILFACAGYNKQLDCILNELELITFVADQFQFCSEIWTLVASLPLFAISRLEISDGHPLADLSNYEETDEAPNTITFINMMKTQGFDDLYLLADQIKPKFYKNLFTVENTELFEAMLGLSFMPIIYGLVSEKPEDFKKFLESITED